MAMKIIWSLECKCFETVCNSQLSDMGKSSEQNAGVWSHTLELKHAMYRFNGFIKALRLCCRMQEMKHGVRSELPP